MWVMPVIILYPYTKFEVRSSDDIADFRSWH